MLHVGGQKYVTIMDQYLVMIIRLLWPGLNFLYQWDISSQPSGFSVRSTSSADFPSLFRILVSAPHLKQTIYTVLPATACCCYSNKKTNHRIISWLNRMIDCLIFYAVSAVPSHITAGTKQTSQTKRNDGHFHKLWK